MAEPWCLWERCANRSLTSTPGPWCLWERCANRSLTSTPGPWCMSCQYSLALKNLVYLRRRYLRAPPSKISLSPEKFKWAESWRICWHFNGKAMIKFSGQYRYVYIEIFIKWDEKIADLSESFSHFRLVRDLYFFLLFVRKSMSRCEATQNTFCLLKK